MSSLKIKTITIAVIMTFLMSFLLSYKVIAVDLTQNVEFLGTISGTPNFSPSSPCTGTGNYMYNTGSGGCGGPVKFSFTSSTGVNNQYILVFQFNLYETRDREAIHGYLNSTPTIEAMRNGQYWGTQPSFMGWSNVNVSESSNILYLYVKMNGTGTINTADYFNIWHRIWIQPNEYISMGNNVQVWATTGVSFNDQGIINAIQASNSWLAQINQNIQELKQALINNSGTQQLNEAENRSEEAAQEGEDNANQGQTDTEQASTNIIGVMGNVIGAFNTGARSTCQLNMNLGNINFGRIDFCKDKPSAWQQMLGGAMSIVLVYVVYRVAKNVFNIFMSAMVFAQGGDRKDG